MKKVRPAYGDNPAKKPAVGKYKHPIPPHEKMQKRKFGGSVTSKVPSK